MAWLEWLRGKGSSWPPIEYRPWSHMLYAIHVRVLESGRDGVVITKENVREWLTDDVRQQLGEMAPEAFDEAVRQVTRRDNRIRSPLGTTTFRAAVAIEVKATAQDVETTEHH